MRKLFDKIKKNPYGIFTFLSCLLVIFWYFNFVYWQLIILNFIFLGVYFLINAFWWGRLLAKLLDLEREFVFIFGLFFLVFLIAFFMAIPIVLYRITPVYLFIILFLLPIIVSWLNRPARSASEQGRHFHTEEKKKLFSQEKPVKISKIFYLLILFAGCFCLGLLFRGRTGNYIRTPWTVIHPIYLYSWLILVFFFLVIIFKKPKLKTFLLLLIFISLIGHLFLIIPYQAGFGGDKWRHLGAERYLAQGEIYHPALFGGQVEYQQLGPLKIPEVFLVGNKTSYANFWGTNIAFSWLTGLDFFYIDLFLGLLFFSIFLPFLLLKIGSFICQRKEFLYLFAFSPLCFSPFLIYGSITVPLSFGFFAFLFSLIFLCNYLVGRKSLNWLLLSFLFLIPFLYFNYILYLAVFLALFCLSFFVKKMIESKGTGKVLLVIGLLFVVLSLSVSFVFLDAANDYSWFNFSALNKENIISSLKDFGNRLLFSTAIFPRVFEMEQDNWLYATSQSELSRSILLKILPWLLILTPIVLILAVLGMISIKKMDFPIIGLVFFLILIILLVNQFIASYLMAGNHIFTKRAVLFISFLFAFFVAWGAHSLIQGNRLFSRAAIIFTLILIFSLLSATVYASGPKSQVVTNDELVSADYLWQELQESKEKTCVLANTWPLLVLEAVSSRQIIAGNFPCYYEYQQPERVFLFDNMNKAPSARYLAKALELTDSSQCFFVTEERFIVYKERERVIKGLKKILGQPKAIGNVLIWLYQPNKLGF